MTRMQAIHEIVVGNEVFKKGEFFFCSPEDAMELDARGAAKAAPLAEPTFDFPEAAPEATPEPPKGKK